MYTHNTNFLFLLLFQILLIRTILLHFNFVKILRISNFQKNFPKPLGVFTVLILNQFAKSH